IFHNPYLIYLFYKYLDEPCIVNLTGLNLLLFKSNSNYSYKLYFSGTSLRKTQEHLSVFNNHNCSYVTVLKWVRKYARLVSNFTDKLNLKVGEELMSDEMEYAVILEFLKELLD
ncbi:MAG: hypothetical protein AABX29_06440, partial [Nanoarchaeota archaeon]